MFIFLGSFVAFRQLYLALTGAIFTPEFAARMADTPFTTWLVNMNMIADKTDLIFFPIALAFPMGWIMASALLIICYRRSKLFRGQQSIN